MRHRPAQTQSSLESRTTPYSIRISSISSSVATLNRARSRAMSSRITNVLSSSSGSIQTCCLAAGAQRRQVKKFTILYNPLCTHVLRSVCKPYPPHHRNGHRLRLEPSDSHSRLALVFRSVYLVSVIDLDPRLHRLVRSWILEPWLVCCS